MVLFPQLFQEEVAQNGSILPIFLFQNYQEVIQINCSKRKVLLGDMISALKFKSCEYM